MCDYFFFQSDSSYLIDQKLQHFNMSQGEGEGKIIGHARREFTPKHLKDIEKLVVVRIILTLEIPHNNIK